MSAKLTEEMRQALVQSKGPLRIVDEQSNTAYVLLREEDYAELKSASDEEDIEPREMYPTMWQIMKEDWNDPAMDVYDRLPEKVSAIHLAKLEECLKASLELS